MPYHAIWGVKMLLAAVLFFFIFALTGRSTATAGLRKNTPKWMAANIIIAMIIVFLSNILKYTSSHLGAIETVKDVAG
jgi:arginine exporter protein ArgO